MTAPLFQLDDVHISTADGVEIVRGVDLTVAAGEVHALMGPNGCGKSTLASALAGSPDYEITSGNVRLHGDDIIDWDPDVRAKAGVFLAFQYPQAIPGVSVRNFLQQAVQARTGKDVSTIEIYMSLSEWMEKLGMDTAFMDRFLNEGFSGGEKKRNEILQLALLEPEIAILDETDSGLDIDALRIVAEGVQAVRESQTGMGVLAITHYQRLLDYLRPDHVHIMLDGRIVQSGGMELVEEIEARGFDSFGATT
ncbi:MAG: Fe-S cluster assembly ATPase SufC [Acidimicrobiales bacterium]|nr:Fe-S cluster assembly ATPase SufC [Acidimicrobiales bacterium]RZV45634.1 MAG: Fe-S cluster assembly ATPase SufC [Acidimicrobiales bacterium]